MPTLFKMSSEKEATVSPTVIIAETTSTASPRKTKKYVIIAVSVVLSAAIVLAAILIGMHFFTEAQKEIVKYSLTFDGNAKQDVTADPNENVVQYHVSTPGQESWIVNDFNKDIQVVKIQTDKGTNCYVSALNRSTAIDPSKVTKPQSSDNKGSSSLIYTPSGTPIGDTSFLSKTARDTCKGVSVYWLYPQCLDKDQADTNATEAPYAQIAHHHSHSNARATTNVCMKGCCKIVCACQVEFYKIADWYGNIQCTWVTRDCNGNPSTASSWRCADGPGCPNRRPARWPVC